MDPIKPEIVFSVFDKLVDRPSTEWPALLDEFCGCDEALRTEVVRLLVADRQAGDFLDCSAVSVLVSARANAPEAFPEIPGYSVVGLLGEGSHGIVYEAVQVSTRRHVALKVLKSGSYSETLRRRFEMEGHVLAVLDHPGIATVFDAGSIDVGQIRQPYFVMQQVKGIRIDQYVADKSLEDCLNLVAVVCDAVHYAHNKGVVHRDLKPANILVDRAGHPKVLDFGVARVLRPELQDLVVHTLPGVAIGTPGFMSPEQARGRTASVDARSDVYSIGAVLYRLLRARSSPCDVMDPVDEHGRLISARVPRALGAIDHRYGGDLGVIVAKAFAERPQDRYQSAVALGRDIRSFLSGQPIEAKAPSGVLILRALIRGHPRWSTVVCALVLILLLGATAGTWYAREKASHAEAETQLRDVAASEARNAQRQFEAARRSRYFEQLTQARDAYGRYDMNEARTLVELCPEDLRGWEWDQTRRLGDQSSFALGGYGTAFYCVAFSPGGGHVGVGDIERNVRLWDVTRAGEPMTLSGHEGPVWALAFSPDGERIAAASMDDTLRIWDARTGGILNVLSGHRDNVTAVTFTPDGKRIVSASWDHTVRIWDANTGEEQRTITGHEDRVLCIAINPDGKRVGSGGWNGELRLWDMGTGAPLMTLGAHARAVSSLAFDAGGNRILSVSWDRTIRMWEVESGRQLQRFVGHEAEVTAVSFSPDGRYVLSGSRDRSLKLWDVNSGKCLRTMPGHADSVHAVAYHPGGQVVASASEDGTLRFWEPGASAEAELLEGHLGAVWAVAFRPEGKWIASGGRDGAVNLWNVDRPVERWALVEHEEAVLALAFSHDGTELFTGGADGTVRIWNVDAPIQSRVLLQQSGAVLSVAVSANDNWIGSGGVDGTATVLNRMTGKQVSRFDGNGTPVMNVTFSPIDNWIASGHRNGTINVWDPATGRTLHEINAHEDGLTALAWSPDGHQLVSSGSDRMIKLWNAHTGDEEADLEGHSGHAIYAVGFSPDGERILSAAADHTLKLWDRLTGINIMTLDGHGDSVTGFAFSPDGRLLVSSSVDGTLRIWDSRPMARESLADVFAEDRVGR